MKVNEVWVLVELPPNGKIVGSKWIFKKKTDMDGNYSNASKCKTYLGKFFAMKDLEKILERYCMDNSKRESIPMQEKLKLSRSQGASTPAEMKRMHNVPYASAVGSIIGDLKQELRVSCYTDAGYLTDADDLKSQTRYVFVLNGGAVDWKSAKQSIFANSSA
nr:hypothetical protein [Tanacetum cinerariifolium]